MSLLSWSSEVGHRKGKRECGSGVGEDRMDSEQNTDEVGGRDRQTDNLFALEEC